MKLFLTGGTGFLGRNIFDKWVGDCHLYSRGESFSDYVNYQPDYVIHAAGEIKEEGMMMSSNIELTHELLKRTPKSVKAFIYIGSSSEYGRKTKPMSERDLLEPTTLYEATKGATTLICQAYANKVPVMIARPFSLYGKHERSERFIPTAIRCAKAGWDLPVAPGNHDFIYVDDFIEGLFLMIQHPHPGHIFNFGTGIQRSNEEALDVIEKVVGRKVKRKPVPSMREYDSNNWVCDYAKANAIYGWRPKTTFEEGIRRICGK